KQISWGCSGPQLLMIQRMVDFFWNVGSPEAEIDRLNSVGEVLNPLHIGSWIEMSDRGGLDGGWFFPMTSALESALVAAESGQIATKLKNWAAEHGVTK